MNKKIQERLLRFQFDDFTSTYEELLRQAEKSTMLVNRLKTLCQEIYKTLNDQNPTYMQEFFKKPANRISLRFPNNLEVPRVQQVSYGTKSLYSLGPKIWNALPEDLKSSTSFSIFKKNIKRWKGPSCECNFCKYTQS